MLIWLLSTTGALQAGNTEISVGVRTSVEYDDNITLANTTGGESTSDLVLRIGPTIGVRIPWEDHAFLLDFNGNHREGLSSGISDLNLSAMAGIELEFANGLQLNLSDTYTRTSFDQELREEAATPDSDTHRLQLTGSYRFVERLRAEASYSQQTQDFKLEDQSTVVDRDLDSFEGKLFVPMTRSAVAYVSYSLEEQDSPDRPDRTYEEEGYRLGVSWEGPGDRFDLRIEVGQESLDFNLAGQEDFDDTVGELDAGIKLTEFTAVELAIGRDGFGELTYAGSISHRNDRDFAARLAFGRQTQTSFSFVFRSSVLHSTHIDLTLSNRLADRFTVSLNTAYQVQESAFSEEERDDRLLNATLQVGYPVRDWLQLEARYQFSRRTSGQHSLAFENNRVGLYAAFSFQGGR